jgi:hypothetical protein
MPNRLRFRRIIEGQVQPIFKFDISKAAFTPKMAKRNSAGPFAAGVMVQGKMDGTGTPDSLTFSRGSQIVGNWYQNLDPYQGSIVFWITPEWNGNDGLIHTIISEPTIPIKIGKKADNKLYLTVGTQTASVDISAWVAGTTYNIVTRWDSKNTLDGTNYLCISVNDVHTFGGTTAPVIVTPSTTLNLGSATTTEPMSGILEGLCWVRRVIFDGSYGIDVGNADEVALIYGGGV